jgi:amidase
MGISASIDQASTKTDAFIEKTRLAPYRDGSLTGLTFAVKDLFDVVGKVTGCGNPTWKATHAPAAANAVCIELLLAEGATCLGKTVTDELAFDLIGENHFYGTPLNARTPDRVPGGSSSGSAAAIAGGFVDFALGTDTGGSIRVPASNCGLFGYRPSHAMISIAGVAMLAPSFDTVGVLAATAETLTKVASVLLCCAVPSASYVRRFIMLKEAFELVGDEMNAALAEPLQKIQTSLGLTAETLSARRIDRKPTEGGLDDWLATFRTVRDAETWSVLGSWIEAHKPSFGPRVATNFEYARNIDRKEVAAAMKFRETLFRRCDELLQEGDILCIPTVGGPAPLKGSIGADRYKNDYLINTLSLTSISGICRLPEVTLPVAEIGGLPLGISLLSKHRQDLILLGAAAQAAKGALAR